MLGIQVKDVNDMTMDSLFGTDPATLSSREVT